MGGGRQELEMRLMKTDEQLEIETYGVEVRSPAKMSDHETWLVGVRTTITKGPGQRRWNCAYWVKNTIRELPIFAK